MDNHHIPPIQTEAPTKSPVSSFSPNKFALIILLVIFMVIFFSLITYFLVRSQFSSQSPIISLPSFTLSPTSAPISSAPTPISSPTHSPIDETANWKTYVNTAYKYSIKYPSEWKIITKNQADPATFDAPYLDSSCNYEAGNRCGQIQISTEEYQPQTSLDNYLRITTAEPWPDRIIEKQTTKLGNESAITMEYFKNNYFYGSGPDDHGIILQVTKAVHGNFVYSLVVSESGKDRANITSTKDWKNKTLYDQILSTFEFTQ